MNLLLNAATAIGPRGGAIRIEASVLPSGRIEIRVEDDGPGVASSLQARLFDPFVTRNHPEWPWATRSDNSQGTGLGLAVCRHLIEQSHGAIRYEPAAELTGAAFIIELDPATSQSRREAC